MPVVEENGPLDEELPRFLLGEAASSAAGEFRAAQRIRPRRRGAEPAAARPGTPQPRRPRVYLASAFPAVERLAASFEVSPSPDEVEAIIAFRTTTVDAALMDRAGGRLRIIANFGVGHDNIDLAAARVRGIIVTTTPDFTTADVASLALGLIIDAMRLISLGDRLIRSGDLSAFEPGLLLGRSVVGAAVGIVGGRGRIGGELARLLEACGANVTIAGRGELDTLVGNVDVLALTCPLTSSTRHLIDRTVLDSLGRETVIVNVARGAVIDEAALVHALERGAIAGAALDVYEYEPHVSKRLLALDNVVLTPHLGAATLESRAAKADAVCDELGAVLIHTREPANRVC